MFLTKQVNVGDVVDVTAACPTFESDLKKLCANMKTQILTFEDSGGGAKKATIRA